MNPEQARELRHELRTPVNHLIGYAELLLEEEGVDPASATRLDAIRTVARQVLKLVPGLLAEDGSAAESARALAGHVREIQAAAAALRSAPGPLPASDLDRIAAAAARLGEFAGSLADGGISGPRHAGVAREPRQGGRETILVVDDDEANRDVLGRRLQRLGYGVIEARDGIEALERLAEGGIDLVLLDVMMPRLDGFAVLARHHADPAIRDIPVIMISALDDTASVVRCIEAGAEDYLAKPFDPVLLKARVGACIEKKRLRDQEKALLATVEGQAEELRAWNRELEARAAEKAREIEVLRGLQRFLPPQLAQALQVNGDHLLESHRREVSVLFCDLRGFTAFSEKAEPEDVMAVLRELHESVGPAVFEHQGTLVNFTGDGMMVLFNDPLPCPDHPHEAVLLALALREHTGRLAPAWRSRGHDLGMGIGVALGFATCGRIGFEGRYEYTAIGTVCNLAARLCAVAERGQILVTDRIRAAVESHVATEPVGTLELKGLARPIEAFNVVGLRVAVPG